MEPKKALFTGLGWFERTQEKIEELVEELVERGELARKDSSGFIRQVMEQAKGEREEFRKIVEEIVRDAAGSAGIATRDELEDVRARLASLESNVTKMNKAETPVKKPARKKSATAKPAVKKVKKKTTKKTAAVKKAPAGKAAKNK